MASMEEQVAQVKAISHPLRMQILKFLRRKKQPTPIKDLAVELNEDASKLHYHFKILEKANLIAVTDTKEINGITEKYYSLLVEDDFTLSLKSHQKEVQTLLPVIEKNALDIIRRIQTIKSEDNYAVFGLMRSLSLNTQQAKNIKEQLENLVSGKDSSLSLKDQDENGQEYDFMLFFVPKK